MPPNGTGTISISYGAGSINSDATNSEKLISCIKGHYIAPSGFELEGLVVAALAVLLTLGYFLTVYLADGPVQLY